MRTSAIASGGRSSVKRVREPSCATSSGSATTTEAASSSATWRAAWEAMGKPEYLSARQVAALEGASEVVAEPLDVAHDGTRTRFTLDLPPDAMALVRIDWESVS